MLLSTVIHGGSGTSIQWISDDISLFLDGVPSASFGGSPAVVQVSMTANHVVLGSEGGAGHWGLEIAGERSPCFEWHATERTIVTGLRSLGVSGRVGRVGVSSSGNGYERNSSFGYVRSISFTNWTRNTNVTLFHGAGEDCSSILTYGLWSDADNWDTGDVPGSDDDVTIPADAGFVNLGMDITVNSLTMHGGTINTQRSNCPSAWAKPNRFDSGGEEVSKCYSPFYSSTGVGEQGLGLNEAQAACRTITRSVTGNLVQIHAWSENEYAKELCGGLAGVPFNPAGSNTIPPPQDPLCWIGLNINPKEGVAGGFQWVSELDMTELRWRSFARGEPNNFTTDIGGEECVAMAPALFDVEKQHMGLWNDEKCTSPLPFICEQYATNEGRKLVLEDGLRMYGGAFVGGGVVKARGDNNEIACTRACAVTDAARLELSGDTVMSSTLQGGDGALIYVVNGSRLSLSEGARFQAVAGPAVATGADPFNGLSESSDGFVTVTSAVPGGRRPRLLNGGVIEFDPTTASERADIEWFTINEGILRVTGDAGDAALVVSGGGVHAKGVVELRGESTVLDLANHSVAMSVSPTFSVTVSSDLMIKGVDKGSDGVDTNFPDATDILDGDEDWNEGTYRLGLTVPGALGAEGGVHVSECIPYHASARHLERILNRMAGARVLGGVSVVDRHGDGSTERWDYGYRYTVVFDSSNDIAVNGLDSQGFTLHCQGSRNGCGCAETTADHLINGNVQYFCGDKHNSSLTDPDACTTTPGIDVAVLNEGGQSAVRGSGTLVVSGGMHRLPSVLRTALRVESGTAVVTARNISAPAVRVKGGVLTLGGTSFEGMDNAMLLYEDAQRYRRDSLTHRAMNAEIAGLVHVSGGEVRIATNDFASGVAAQKLIWDGGHLSGWASVTISDELVVNGTASRSIGAAMRLICEDACAWLWDGSGKVSMSEGSAWINRGAMVIQTQGAEAGYDASWDGWAEPQQWSGTVWFTNPLCGQHCRRSPYFLNSGVLVVDADAEATIGLTLRHIGSFTSFANSTLTLAGGGDGIGSWEVNGTLAMSGGAFVMDRDSVVAGSGVIHGSGGGPHSLADVIGPRVVLSGGKIECRSRFQELHSGLGAWRTLVLWSVALRLCSVKFFTLRACAACTHGSLLAPSLCTVQKSPVAFCPTRFRARAS